MKTQRIFMIALCLLLFLLSTFHCLAQENKRNTSVINQKARVQFESVRKKITGWIERGEIPSVSNQTSNKQSWYF